MNYLAATVYIYCLAIIIQALYGAIQMEDRWTRKKGARLILTAPFWPLVAAAAISRGTMEIIRSADLRNKRRR